LISFNSSPREHLVLSWGISRDLQASTAAINHGSAVQSPKTPVTHWNS